MDCFNRRTLIYLDDLRSFEIIMVTILQRRDLKKSDLTNTVVSDFPIPLIIIVVCLSLVFSLVVSPSFIHIYLISLPISHILNHRTLHM